MDKETVQQDIQAMPGMGHWKIAISEFTCGCGYVVNVGEKYYFGPISGAIDAKDEACCGRCGDGVEEYNGVMADERSALEIKHTS